MPFDIKPATPADVAPILPEEYPSPEEAKSLIFFDTEEWVREVETTQKLATELGLGVGISSGANFLAALEAEERLGDGSAVVTVFADSNKKYLSTGLLADEPVHVLPFNGVRYDCGSKIGYLRATVEYGLRHPELGASFRAYLQNVWER